MSTQGWLANELLGILPSLPHVSVQGCYHYRCYGTVSAFTRFLHAWMASTSLTEESLRPWGRLLKVHKTNFFLIYFFSFFIQYTLILFFLLSQLHPDPPTSLPTCSFSFSQKRNPNSQNKIKTNNPKKTKKQNPQKMNKQNTKMFIDSIKSWSQPIVHWL